MRHLVDHTHDSVRLRRELLQSLNQAVRDHHTGKAAQEMLFTLVNTCRIALYTKLIMFTKCTIKGGTAEARVHTQHMGSRRITMPNVIQQTNTAKCDILHTELESKRLARIKPNFELTQTLRHAHTHTCAR